jgi:hypothetical protein
MKEFVVNPIWRRRIDLPVDLSQIQSHQKGIFRFRITLKKIKRRLPIPTKVPLAGCSMKSN